MNFQFYKFLISGVKQKGFTLIEILLAITLSSILMTGIVVFVSSSLGSNITTKRILEDGNKNEKIEQHLMQTLGNVSTLYVTGASFGEYLTGTFLGTKSSNLPITFLGLRTETGYCDSYSGTADAPETVLKLAIRQFAVPTEQNNVPGYTLSSTGNSISFGTNRIIGTGYPGNDLDTNSGALTELSSPSALISSGNHLYIADTMNDRVLSYDITSGSIMKLLGPENGIRKPTSLYFSGNILLIASSGNGKIFSLQDGDTGNGSTFSGAFQVANNFQADNIRFTFSGISFVTQPTTTGDFILDGVTQKLDDVVTPGTNLQYTLSGGVQNFSAGTLYKFRVSNISTPPTTPGNYTVQIDFLSGNTLQYFDTFHYFTKGDGSLESNTGNIIKIISGGHIYPHNITGANNWDSTIDWNTVLGQNPPGNEVFSSLPIQDFSSHVIGKILTLRYHQYIKYDCILGKHQIEEKIFKILLP
ncbi:MAG: prepilin-type N-terminal cleavage/methylation domain-containing protein [Candidatus Gracilibacteria bacterium]|nr:prepilin-type N-terminal cleavage/methylation domain-containing protein [Candidatus Gracilibacteria bacterium]